jgi:hypothetical protein
VNQTKWPPENPGRFSHDVTTPARLGAQNAKAIFGVVVGNSLDEARQHLAVGWFGLDFHEPALLG